MLGGMRPSQRQSARRITMIQASPPSDAAPLSMASRRNPTCSSKRIASWFEASTQPVSREQPSSTNG